MAGQDSTSRPGTDRDRSAVISDPRSRFRVVRSGDGERAGETPHRALRPGIRGGVPARPKIPSPRIAHEPRQPCRLTACPDCQSDLAVLRIIPGRAADYWTLRCTECGGIHLDIIGANKVVQDSGNLSA